MNIAINILKPDTLSLSTLFSSATLTGISKFSDEIAVMSRTAIILGFLFRSIFDKLDFFVFYLNFLVWSNIVKKGKK